MSKQRWLDALVAADSAVALASSQEEADECLNEQWFESLAQARQEIARWRRDYNEVRPHSSLGRIPPARFAAQHRQRAGDAVQSPEIK